MLFIIVGTTINRSCVGELRLTSSAVLLKVRRADTWKLLPEEPAGTVTVKLKKALSNMSSMLSEGLHIFPRKGSMKLQNQTVTTIIIQSVITTVEPPYSGHLVTS